MSKRATTFSDNFLQEVINQQRQRNGLVVDNFIQELNPPDKPKVMISLPLDLVEDVLCHISAGHDHCDESLELDRLVEEFKETL